MIKYKLQVSYFKDFEVSVLFVLQRFELSENSNQFDTHRAGHFRFTVEMNNWRFHWSYWLVLLLNLQIIISWSKWTSIRCRVMIAVLVYILVLINIYIAQTIDNGRYSALSLEWDKRRYGLSKINFKHVFKCHMIWSIR